jgi:hypothetical protein
MYRWLVRRTRRAIWIIAAINILFIPVVFIVDPWQMERGQFSMGGGYTVRIDAVVGQFVLRSPVLFYESFRRSPWSGAAAWRSAGV